MLSKTLGRRIVNQSWLDKSKFGAVGERERLIGPISLVSGAAIESRDSLAAGSVTGHLGMRGILRLPESSQERFFFAAPLIFRIEYLGGNGQN